MSDVLWSDVSEFQVGVDDSYPYQVLAIRSNDGTYVDQRFAANHAWATAALDAGKLAALIIYLVYRPNWSDTLATTKATVGTPHPRSVFMLDVESWNGQITGDNSAAINALHSGLADWLGNNPARVIGYGNTGDLDALWPTKPAGLRLIVAAYGSDPNYPDELGHQFTDGTVGGPLLVPPFGAADVDSADGYDLTAFCAAIGINSGTRKDRQTMDQLPATATPADPNSAPSSWPQRNFDIAFDLAGGWEGECAVGFGGQDWGGRSTDATRSFLYLASWMLADGTLVPVDATHTAAGGGQIVAAHHVAGPWQAPHGAVGVTLNYAAPGGGYAAVGRSA